MIRVRVDSLGYSTHTDLLDVDLYWCTVTKSIKGDLKVGDKVGVVFFADTVKQGEEWAVAAYIVNDNTSDAPVLYFTSRNSLLGLDANII